MSATTDAGLTLRSLLLARLYANRFVIENKQENIDRVGGEIESLRKQSRTLNGELTSSTQRSQLQGFDALVDRLESSFAEVMEVTAKRKAIIKELDALGRKIQADGIVINLSLLRSGYAGPF